ncbi:MAG TPA: hypothetical protein VGX03_00515 [Candidatus Binatia bacterium]|jgi:hypothetical protein|nr:hypothetical protein [Candidatus Binatia bacterium]
MRDILALSLTVLLGVASTLPARAQRPLPSGEADGPCVQEEDATLSLPVTAIVSKIDLRQGRATLETSVGRLELATAPAELQALQTGDVLTLCVDPTALPDAGTAAPSSLG